MSLPTLYKRTSTGKIQTWEIFTLRAIDESDSAQIVTLYGLQGGKQQTAQEWVTEGKNIGKSNETTPYEQAVAEAQSQWEQKVKKGYVENIDDAEQGKIDTNVITGGIEPMLAHSYDKQGHKIQFPAYVQPKLDGHRCIAIVQDGVCTLWSRTRKPIKSIPHIQRQLEALVGDAPGAVVFDGELYNHDYKDKFEELTSLIRQESPKPGHEKVQFWIYDLINADIFSLRASALQRIQDELNQRKELYALVTVSTTEVADEEEMINIFGVFIEYGFEGLMVRNSNAPYKNKRSYDLQKVKVFADAEYKVVAIEEGRGKMAGKAMFVCEVEPGKTFRVKLVGALDDLKDYFENPEPWIGRDLTVKYQGLSADGIPRFPIGVRFREDV